jgi:hypothetical protein
LGVGFANFVQFHVDIDVFGFQFCVFVFELGNLEQEIFFFIQQRFEFVVQVLFLVFFVFAVEFFGEFLDVGFEGVDHALGEHELFSVFFAFDFDFSEVDDVVAGDVVIEQPVFDQVVFDGGFEEVVVVFRLFAVDDVVRNCYVEHFFGDRERVIGAQLLDSLFAQVFVLFQRTQTLRLVADFLLQFRYVFRLVVVHRVRGN